MTARPTTLVAGLIALSLLASACHLPNLAQEESKVSALAQTSEILDDNGNVITTLHAEQNREIVPSNKIPDVMKNAAVAVEDRRFYEHQGIDIRSILRAAYEDATHGSAVQGASTITMQYVKNTITGSDQTLTRKIDQAALAWQMETARDPNNPSQLLYTKDDILTKYLNTVYFGEGAYGVQAAAQAYFSRDASQLNLPQAAMLAGLIQAPVTYDPLLRKKSQLTIDRRNVVLDDMLAQGWINQTDYNKAKRAGLNLHPASKQPQQYDDPYFVDMVKQWFLTNPQFGDYAQRKALLFSGGLRIYTTIDPQMQKAAEKAVYSTLSQSSDPYGALTAIDPRTGEIKAMVGGRDYFARHAQFSKINLATGGTTGRPAGSAAKIFTLVAALEEGMSPNKTYNAPACIDIRDKSVSKPWHVCNAEPASFGNPTITEATWASINTVFAQIIRDEGPDHWVKTALEMGLRCCTRFTNPDTKLLPVLSATLGSNPVNTVEMASAYGTLATGGLHVQPVPVSRITDAEGNLVYVANHQPKQVVDPKIANTAEHILEGVITQGTGTAANIGRPEFGKTGTGQNYGDAWFAGAVPQLTTAVWVGYPEGQKSMCCTRIGTVFGGTWPAEIWHKFMSAATRGMPRENFPNGAAQIISEKIDASRGCLPNKFTPAGVVQKQEFIKGTEPTKKCTQPTAFGASSVPSVVGLIRPHAKSELESAGYKVDVVYQAGSGDPQDTVVSQSPAGGTVLKEQATVTLAVARDAPATTSGGKNSGTGNKSNSGTGGKTGSGTGSGTTGTGSGTGSGT